MPNFYWNNTYAPKLTVGGDLTVNGNTVLQTLSAGTSTLRNTLSVAGKSTLATLQAGATILTSTLGVDGATSLAGLSATNAQFTGTLNVNGSSTFAGGVSGNTTFANNISASDITASGVMSAHDLDIVLDPVGSGRQYIQFVSPNISSTQPIQSIGYVNNNSQKQGQMNIRNYDGTSYHVYERFNPDGTTTGNFAGQDAIKHVIEAYQRFGVGSSSNYTPAPGIYEVYAPINFQYNMGQPMIGGGNLAGSFNFNGSNHIRNVGSTTEFLVLSKWAV